MQLAPLQLKIYQTVRAQPAGISGEALCDRVYADHVDGGPLNARTSVHVQICRLNQRLASVGQKITAARGKLYRLERDVV